MKKIRKEMMIKEIFLSHPDNAEELAEVLAKAGIRCISCCASAWESLEEGLKSHGMSDEKINKIVDELNSIVS